ncbi:MAG: SUF system Fe-S cluster assembly protein [Flavobacteriales bacterium]
MDREEKKQLEQSIVNALKTVYDPEIPVDIYELGLIYEIKINDEKEATIVMTLTSPSCPVAESLPVEVEEKVAGVEGITKASIDLTWEPPWDKDMMSEEALVELGLI